MCEPVTIATMTAAVIGAAVSAHGQVQAGEAAQQQADYQAGVARNNAILAQRAAADARERGSIEENQQRLQTAQLLGRQRASAAARGVLVDSGSAAVQLSDTAAFGELDALTIRNNAEREALGFEAEGANFRGEADLRTQAGRNARIQSRYGVASTLLTSASTVGGQYAQFKSAGMIK